MPKDVRQALEEKENGKQVSVNEESNAAETQEQETANTDVEKIDADKIVQPYIDRNKKIFFRKGLLVIEIYSNIVIADALCVSKQLVLIKRC
ncbi:prophage protein [Lactobacillus iners DSM 13335]|uniref:Uncharacterized protein n=1 Tax=Lactobacillus iners DSM 13335 TaxID=525328 RepID=C8PDE6_9LACO|nr:hypothetical protein [Lactobacillus iners]EEW51496.1 hypothetical protein HMPREF0520_1116 [Lactobacillus iners DSM 13335]KRL58326.1 prophage protein [Lactobacillus iners DSM 13335]